MPVRPSPDPVAEASAYQQMLLSLLGNDDPAEVQTQTVSRVREMIDEAGDDLRRRPGADEWSVLELVGHLVDAELVGAARYRWMLSQNAPELIGYDQDQWVTRLRHNEDLPDDLIALFSALRQADVALWRRSSATERQRVGMHAERGPESFDLLFRMLAGHDRFHLNQMRSTLDQLRKTANA
ncbi:MAG TPA: DinB family protein [Candidatus Dormibacteraeota bacterium]